VNYLKALYHYRYFILTSIKTEFQSRFARSALGGLWMLLHPLAQVAIYALILSAVLSAKLPGINSPHAYAIYLMAGMLGWSLFVEVFSRSLTVFVDNGNLLKKMIFPKMALPLTIVGSALLNNILLFGAIIVVFALLGHFPSWQIIWIPVLMILSVALGLGLGLIAGILNVFMRDISQVVPIILQFWFWLTPVVYATSIIPKEYISWLMLNPMAGIVMGFHNILVYKTSPDWTLLVYPAIVSIITLALSLFMLKRASEEMVDML
jgi:lipopolysaccharide transport system permease protein